MPDAEEALALVERRVAAQASALAQVPLGLPVPSETIALLSTVHPELAGLQLPERCRPRLVHLGDELRAMSENLALRQCELASRITSVRAARRAGPAPHLLDRQG